MNKHTTIASLLMLALSGSATADDAAPTFNLKNKSPQGTIALSIHAPNDQKTTYMQIKKDGNVVYEGWRAPSRPILLLPKHDLSYYDLHNIAALDIFYQENDTLFVDHRTFIDTNDNTTYYIKHCHADTFAHQECSSEFFAPQEGVREKFLGKKTKTTDGYNLENNITFMNYTWAKGKAGAQVKVHKYTPKRFSKVVGTTQLPRINFETVEEEYKQLIKK